MVSPSLMVTSLALHVSTREPAINAATAHAPLIRVPLVVISAPPSLEDAQLHHHRWQIRTSSAACRRTSPRNGLAVPDVPRHSGGAREWPSFRRGARAAQPARGPLQVSALQADAFGRPWPGTPGFVPAIYLRLLDILGWTPMPRNHAAAFPGAPAMSGATEPPLRPGVYS